MRLEDLVEAALEAKLRAIFGYDSIIWKIRAGYTAAIYGALALTLGTRGLWAIDTSTVGIALVVALVFSVSAAIIDSKIRTNSRNSFTSLESNSSLALMSVSSTA
jgi:hypothetical protein